jgi:DNA polymerase III delta prime subunit
MHNPSPREIESFKPNGLNGFACNDRVIQALTRFAFQNGDGGNLLLAGEVGSGKTSLAEVAIRTAFCSETHDAVSGPCGVCHDCKRFDFEGGDAANWAHQYQLDGGKSRTLHYWHCNGYYMDQNLVSELKSDLDQRRHDPDDRTIVFLDEIQEVTSAPIIGHLLEALLKPGSTWIAAGTTIENLHPAIKRRFATSVETTSTPEMLARLIREKCKAWGIHWDSPETLAALAVHCCGTVSDYLGVLSQAAQNDRLLTSRLVSDHQFTTGVCSAG